MKQYFKRIAQQSTWSCPSAASKMGKFLCSFCYDKPVSFLESGIAEHSRVLESGVKKVRDGREST